MELTLPAQALQGSSETKEPEELSTKQHVLLLCKKKEGEFYEFSVPQGTGEDLIQAIRMQMSRLRAKARLRGVKLPAFKIFTHKIKTKDGLDHCSIYRAQPGARLETDHELEKILSDLNSI